VTALDVELRATLDRAHAMAMAMMTAARVPAPTEEELRLYLWHQVHANLDESALTGDLEACRSTWKGSSMRQDSPT
jgi:hypothetical protein